MIKLRDLEEKDIPFMIEWMQDEDLTKDLHKNFAELAKEEIQRAFIANSMTPNNKTFAIADPETDEYLGSISLKNIDYNTKEAEYDICLRRKVLGTGIAKEATNQILMYAFQTLGLENVRLYALSKNVRANKFYNKLGFNYDNSIKNGLNVKGEGKSVNYYSINKTGFSSLYKSREEQMTNVHRVNFQEITDNRGKLIAIENPKQLECPLNRIYYIYDVKDKVVRGKHAHEDLEQVLICVKGGVTITTKTPYEEKDYILDKPYEGLYIGNMIWREMKYFSNDAVLLVLASKKYNPDDYIRNYEDYEEKAIEYFKNTEDENTKEPKQKKLTRSNMNGDNNR